MQHVKAKAGYHPVGNARGKNQSYNKATTKIAFTITSKQYTLGMMTWHAERRNSDPQIPFPSPTPPRSSNSCKTFKQNQPSLLKIHPHRLQSSLLPCTQRTCCNASRGTSFGFYHQTYQYNLFLKKLKVLFILSLVLASRQTQLTLQEAALDRWGLTT